ncbi:MAG: glycosyltransferase [Bacteroidia bacterium]|nr:glycosyltransferase [Bacteroidia bacterium]
MTKKNILILSPDSPYNSMGGLGVHLLEILRRFDNQKYEVTVLAQCSPNCIINNCKVFGVSVYNFELGNGFRETLSETYINQSRFISVFNILLNNGSISKPDIIHCMDWSTGIAAFEITLQTGAKLVFAIHLSISNYLKNVSTTQVLQWEIAKKIEFKLCQQADAILQVSDNYSNLFPFFAFKNKTYIIPNGVDCKDYEKSEPFKHVGKNRYKIVYIGRFADMKNVDVLSGIDIPKNCDLIFIGGAQGGEQSLINRVVERSKVCKNIHYVGTMYGKEKINALCAADLIIMPSIHEPFGLVALEACAAAIGGKTVFASSFVGGMSEFLNSEAAINCGTTKESIEKSLFRFLKMSENEKKKMRSAAISIAKKYSWDNTTQNIQQVYDNLLNNN